MNNYRLYTKRTLTENVNMVFDFVGENWRQWFKIMLYFLLPFSVVLGTTIASFNKDIDTFFSESIPVIPIVLLIVGYVVVTTLVILMVKWYETHNGSLEGCDCTTMLRMMPKPALKCLGIIVLWTPILVLSFASIIIPIVGLVMIFAMLPVFLLCPIMLLEPQNSFVDTTKRAFSLGYKKWGALIMIAIIMTLVGILLNNAVSFPLGILMAVESLFNDSTSDSMFWSLLSDVVIYILCVAECFMIFVEAGLLVMAMTYHYGSVAAEVEDIGLESEIENFSNL